jgi:hypothetical protein
MYSHNYAKELSLRTSDKKIPVAYVVLIFVLVAGLMMFGYQKLRPLLAAAHIEQVE